MYELSGGHDKESLLISAETEVAKLGIVWGDWCFVQDIAYLGMDAKEVGYWSLDPDINDKHRTYVGVPGEHKLVKATAALWETVYVSKEYKGDYTGPGKLHFGVPLLCWISWRNGAPAHWEVRIQGAEEVLARAAWDDIEGFTRLVALLHDEATIQQMISLMNPKVGQKLYEATSQREALKLALTNYAASHS